MSGASISLTNVSKSYGKTVALAPLTLEFTPGTTTVLIGPSGCGKSTLIRIVMGLILPDSGTVRVDNDQLTASNVASLRHKMGYVVQEGGLFPHLTGRANVTLLARHLGWPKDKIDARVAELSSVVQLRDNLIDRYPSELSGGQRQRLGLMRALMLDPPALLLDEPLGALDPITRYELQEELRGIFDRLGKTVILVTHDMGEASYFGGTIVLMRDGRIVQKGSWSDFVDTPADEWVSRFLMAQRAPVAPVQAGAPA